ncbi:MAG: SpoIID/LytB domain-containing protein [Planctomycetota bacterium]
MGSRPERPFPRLDGILPPPDEHPAQETSAGDGRRLGRRGALFLLGLSLCALLFVSHLLNILSGSSRAAASGGPAMRILLASSLESLEIRGAELHLAADGTRLGSAVEIRGQSRGLLLLGASAPRVLDRDDCRLSWEGSARIHYRGAGGKRVEREELGSLRVLRRAAGLRAILHTELETYLGGVLEAEMGARFDAEALRAQVVAARSYALSSRARSEKRDFDVFDDERSQVYRGAGASPPVLRAVRATAGEVLLFKGKVLRAYYASTCGGRTRDGRERFRDVPAGPLRSVSCEGCTQSPLYRWKRRLNARLLGLGDRGRPELRVLERSARGDWKRVFLRFGKGKWRSPGISELARKLSLPSVWITDATPDGASGLLLHGRGFGHGVGLCQYGADGYAKRGWDYRRILAAYYPGTRVEAGP